MEPLSPWTVYWIMQADAVRGSLGGLCVFVASGAFALSMIWLFCHSEDFCNVPETKRFFARLALRFNLLFVLLAFALAFIPKTKTLAAMYVLPQLLNSESVRQEAGELYDLAKEALKEMAGDDGGE